MAEFQSVSEIHQQSSWGVLQRQGKAWENVTVGGKGKCNTTNGSVYMAAHPKKFIMGAKPTLLHLH